MPLPQEGGSSQELPFGRAVSCIHFWSSEVDHMPADGSVSTWAGGASGQSVFAVNGYQVEGTAINCRTVDSHAFFHLALTDGQPIWRGVMASQCLSSHVELWPAQCLSSHLELRPVSVFHLTWSYGQSVSFVSPGVKASLVSFISHGVMASPVSFISPGVMASLVSFISQVTWSYGQPGVFYLT